MNDSYPRYQYSVFLKNARDEQLVIRADKFEDLIEAKKNIDKIVEKHEVKEPTVAPKAFNVSVACSKCGGATERKEGVNKAGRPYKGNFCNNLECKNVDWF